MTFVTKLGFHIQEWFSQASLVLNLRPCIQSQGWYSGYQPRVFYSISIIQR